MEIAMDNAGSDTASGDSAWPFLYKLVQILGLNGMSSDESCTEGRKCVVKIRGWRSAELTPYLDIIDQDRNSLNAFGNHLQGNLPRERIRNEGARPSVRRAIAGLPLNFYDATWYASLTPAEKRRLKPLPVITLPKITRH